MTRINANADGDLRRSISVFLNGQKEPNAVEVFVPGNALEGPGYVVRMVRVDGQAVPIHGRSEPLAPGQYDYEGALCEKVFGLVRIEIAEDEPQFKNE